MNRNGIKNPLRRLRRLGSETGNIKTGLSIRAPSLMCDKLADFRAAWCSVDAVAKSGNIASLAESS